MDSSLRIARSSTGLEYVFPVPAQADRVGIETDRREDFPAVPRGDKFRDSVVGHAAHAFADAQGKVIIYGDEPTVE
jgi:hypothetical protein